MKKVKALLIGLAVALLVLFVAQNLSVLMHKQTLKLDLLFVQLATPPLPLALMLVVCLVVGAAVAWAAAYPEKRRLRRELRNLNRRQNRTDQELSSLRNLPVSEGGLDQTTPSGTLRPMERTS
jgi:uncharacterized integral membrane protein